MAAVWYATVEQVKTAGDVAESARADRLIAEKLGMATESVRGLCKREFAPWQGTRYFGWPQDEYGSSRELYLGRNELITLDSVVTGVGDGDIPVTGGSLYPQEYGPPYSSIVLNHNTSEVFTQGAVPERSNAVTGGYGFRIAESAVTTTVTTLAAASTSVTVTDGSRFGWGSLIRIGTERLIVTGRRWSLSSNIEGITLAKDAAATTVTVTDGDAFTPGEEILIDAERMLITDIAGDTLVVRRNTNGTVLAAHTAVTEVYVLRKLLVDRAQQGSAAAVSVAAGATVYLFEYPGLVNDLTVAYALVGLNQSRAKYAATAGSGENVVETRGLALAQLEKRVRDSYRRVRKAAV